MQSYTFWQLAKKYTIEIPIVQRDYAQGRTDKRAESIRNTFLAELIKALEEDKPLELDFVYGKVNNGVFTPIDGQQRLTTLFLLHWYIAAQLGLGEKEFKTINVTYKTRVSARDFCAAIIAHPIKISDSSEISKQIEDASWFFLAWKKDPTVQSMLVMLDAIQKKLKNIDNLNPFWEKLTNLKDPFPSENTQIKELVECITSKGNDEIKGKLKEVSTPSAISFKFLNMGGFELNDELYLKMNARGRALSDWENFKASFLNHLGTENALKISPKLDNEWTDIFWGNRSAKNEIDTIYFTFINRFTLNHYINHSTSLTNEGLSKSNDFFYLSGNDTDDTKIQFLDFSIYKEIIDNTFVDELTNVFNSNKELITKQFSPQWSADESFYFIPKYETDKDGYEKLSNLTQKNRVVFSALIAYLKKGEFSGDSFQKWMRIVWNIVENAGINSVASMIGAIKLINELGSHSHKIEEFLSNSENVLQSQFAKEQVAEERLKLSLMRKDNDWRREIIEAEKHSFFKGQIRFLLQDNCNTDFAKFEKRSKVAKKIFDKDGAAIGKETNLLGRTILSIGLAINPENDDDIWLGGFEKQYWKEHLRDERFIKSILDIIDSISDQDNLSEDSFNKIIDDKEESFEECIWKKNLIRNPKLFSDYSAFGRIIKNWRGINLYQRQKFNENVNAILIGNNRNEGIGKIINKGYKLTKDVAWLEGQFYAGGDIIVSKDQQNYVIDKDGNVKKEDVKDDEPKSIDIFLK